MELTWKKILGLALLVTTIVIVPLLLLTNTAMGYYQSRIDGNPKSGFNRWLQLTSAAACMKTLRPELAADRYRKYMEHYPQDEQRPYALLQLARALEEANRTTDSMKTYQRFIEEYPHRTEDVKDCEMSIDRLKYVKPR